MVVNVYSTSVTSENISRQNLLAWVNDCLQSKFTKIEEMATGAAYCQLTDFLFPDRVPLKKVKWNGRSEVDWRNNWQVLQHAWKEIGIDKPVPVPSLLRAKFQDNFEFLQWFKKFFDANYDGREYDPAGARNHEEFPAALPGGATRKAPPPMTFAAAAPRRSMATASSKPPTGAATARAVPAAKAAMTTTSRPSTGPSTLAPARKPPSLGASAGNGSSASSAGKRRPTPSPQNGSAGGPQKQLMRTPPKQRAMGVEKELASMRASLDTAERERSFYYDKLRQIAALCEGVADGAAVPVEQLRRVLSDRAESNSTGRAVNRSGTSEASSLPRGDAFPVPMLESPDDRRLQEMLEERKEQQSRGSNNDTSGAGEQQQNSGSNFGLDTAHLEDTFLELSDGSKKARGATSQNTLSSNIIELSEEDNAQLGPPEQQQQVQAQSPIFQPQGEVYDSGLEGPKNDTYTLEKGEQQDNSSLPLADRLDSSHPQASANGNASVGEGELVDLLDTKCPKPLLDLSGDVQSNGGDADTSQQQR